ncbi:unnamed protein product [Prunus armeniaca]
MVAKISMFWAGVRRARRARRARRSLGGVKVGARRSRRALRLEKKKRHFGISKVREEITMVL